MGSCGDSLESLSGLCNYSHWQALKNDPGLALTPREKKNITADSAGGAPKAVIALSLFAQQSQPAKPNPTSQGCSVMLYLHAPSLGKWAAGV